MTIAIHYTSVKTTTDREVFGLRVAVENWLRAWFRYGSQEKYNFLIGATAEWEQVQELAQSAGLDAARLIGLDRRYPRDNFAALSTIMRLNPDPGRLFWQRQMLPAPGYNVCTLTHAVAGIEAGEILEKYCLSPTTDLDAIVCPSQAVKAAIRSFFDLYGDYLKQRFGTSFRCPVQLPVIPLGVDIEKYETITTPDLRKDQRQKLGLDDDETMVLWVGRLSYAIKAHPLAMFQAVERAAKRTGKKVHLVMVGYFVPAESEKQFQDLARDICHEAKVSFIASDDIRFPDGLWAAGDIFLSLIDNMQESFGLTPIEAMAAGLPRVISDWNGYRDCVRQGEDGFLIPTRQPPPGTGAALSELLINSRDMYGGYLAKTALTVSVDQEIAAEALALLIQDKDLRKTIADKARARVRVDYHWKHIIAAYEALWKENSARRTGAAATAQTKWPTPLPQAPDPFTMYATYPTAPLKLTDRLEVAASAEEIRLLWKHEINVLALDTMLPPEEATKLVNFVGKKPGATIQEIFQSFASAELGHLWRALGWLIKLGILRIEP